MKKLDLIQITPKEMFTMIEDFADGILSHLDHVPIEDMSAVSEQLLETFRQEHVEGRIAIIILLHTACAMYRVAADDAMDAKSCPTDLLN